MGGAYKLVAIGEATAGVIRQRYDVAFVSETADAISLGTSYPSDLGPRILLACSALQKPTLREALEKRGFEVTTLHTYTTEGRKRCELNETEVEALDRVEIWTFASPSAVEAVNRWNIDLGHNSHMFMMMVRFLG